MPPKIVDPIFIASVLPFGTVKRMDNGIEQLFFRFSLSIDIKPTYGDNEVPRSSTMLNFLRGYHEQGHYKKIKEILSGQKILINGNPTREGIDYCFTVFNNIAPYWKLLGMNEADLSKTADSLAKHRDITQAPITTFLNLRENLPNGDAVRKIGALALQKAAGNFLLHDIDMLEAEYTKAFDELTPIIKTVNNHLSGIYDFATAHNDTESGNMTSLSTNANYANIGASWDTLIEAVSFINSNIVLQRLFGLTIDFEIPQSAFIGLNECKIKLPPDLFGPLNDGSPHPIKWLYPTTPIGITVVKGIPVVTVQQVQEAKMPTYGSRNYDLTAKIKSIESINQNVKEILHKIREAEQYGQETQRVKMVKRLIKIDSAALTRGINIYQIGRSTRDEPAAKETDGARARDEEHIIHLKDIVTGNRYGVITAKEIRPLGQRILSIKGISNLPKEFSIQNVAAGADAGMHALLIDDTGDIIHKQIVDEVMLTWAGENIGMPSVFSNHEREDNFSPTTEEGSISMAFKIVSDKFQSFFRETFFPTGVIYKNGESEAKQIPLEFRYSFGLNAKLLFGKEYEIVFTPEYKNGWAVPFEHLNKSLSHHFGRVNHRYKRNEPVQPICFFAEHELTDKDNKKQPAQGREGESLLHLAIRNYSDADDDKITKTKQKSVRYILPPAISFQQALWHNKLFNDKADEANRMPPKESYKWYLKHHFSATMGDGINQNGEFADYTEKEIVEKSTAMRDCYPDGFLNFTGKEDIINYLPDPLSSGFRFEFFIDKEHTIKAPRYETYEQQEYYFSGNYPKINAWKVIIEDLSDHVDLVEYEDEEIRIRVDKGTELFILARTILSEAYEIELETFGCYNTFTQYGNNDLLTPPLEFSIVHAVQRPLVRPSLKNLLACERDQDRTWLYLRVVADLEQLSIYRDNRNVTHYLDDMIPTGDIELLAKWEEYIDDPRHVTTDDWTPLRPVNKVNLTRFDSDDNSTETPATFETKIKAADQLIPMEQSLGRVHNYANDYRNYVVELAASYDVRDTKFVEKVYWVKNRSKFINYYPAKWLKEELADAEKNNHFCKISSEPFTVKIPNSKKPNQPASDWKNINAVSVIDEYRVNGRNDQRIRAITRRRLRFFFERNRLSSGNNEKIGYILNEPESKYNEYFLLNGMISVVGRDSVSDSVKPYDGLYRSTRVLLTRANFVINDPYKIRNMETGEQVGDLESFSPEYVKELGIMTYQPKFDKKLNVWYVDVELDINDALGRELHSPFVQFGIVHYQKHSVNKNEAGEASVSKDCRISNVLKSSFVYLMGSLTIVLTHEKRSVNINLQFDKTSIKLEPVQHQTKYYGVIQHRRRGTIKWTTADKAREGDHAAFIPLSNIPQGHNNDLPYIKYTNTEYQLIVLETEDWGNNNDTSLERILENKASRVVMTSTFDL